jgi:O-acetyl-ADP-ribose deacetylase (regulator of RNase III)
MSNILRTHPYPSGQRLEIVQGDLTQEKVDAIVNPANSQLVHGGGLAGIIVRQGGSTIQEESDAWVREHGPVSHAAPAHTAPGQLPCQYIIHAVGPIWGSGEEDAKLADAITGSLALADRLALTSIAFPAISTGIFGFPKDRAAGVIFQAIHRYFAGQPDSGMQLVRITLYDQPTLTAFLGVWDRMTQDKNSP